MASRSARRSDFVVCRLDSNRTRPNRRTRLPRLKETTCTSSWARIAQTPSEDACSENSPTDCEKSAHGDRRAPAPGTRFSVSPESLLLPRQFQRLLVLVCCRRYVWEKVLSVPLVDP